MPIQWIQARRATPRTGFAPPEGPFPEHGVAEVLHWLVAPVGAIEVATPKAGRHLVTLRFGNIAADQILTIRLGDTELLRTPLPVIGWQERIEIDLALDLPHGTSVLDVVAPRAVRDEGAGRDLHVAAFTGRVTITDRADGLCEMRRLRLLENVWHNRDDLPVGLTPEQAGDAFARHLLPLAGYDRVEGPYPNAGIARRLAWQVRAGASIDFLNPCEGPGTVAIDLMLPCRQDLTVALGSDKKRFTDLPASTWHRPTRIIIQSAYLERGWIRIAIEAASSIVDDSGRSLRAALLDVSAGPVAFAFAATENGDYALVFPEVECGAHA